MKPRTSHGSRQTFWLRQILFIILLQEISARPDLFRGYPIQQQPFNSKPLFTPLLANPIPQNVPQLFAPQLPQNAPQLLPSQQLAPSDCTSPVKSPPKEKKPHPVFFPYTVPIPWPTPFNGTDFAPIPNATSPVLPTVPDSSDEDTYPLYVPVPHFEYVPVYYNAPKTVTDLSAKATAVPEKPEPSTSEPAPEEVHITPPDKQVVRVSLEPIIPPQDLPPTDPAPNPENPTAIEESIPEAQPDSSLPAESSTPCDFHPNFLPVGWYPRPGFPVSYPYPTAPVPPEQVWAHPPGSVAEHHSPAHLTKPISPQPHPPLQVLTPKDLPPFINTPPVTNEQITHPYFSLPAQSPQPCHVCGLHPNMPYVAGHPRPGATVPYPQPNVLLPPAPIWAGPQDSPAENHTPENPIVPFSPEQRHPQPVSAPEDLPPIPHHRPATNEEHTLHADSNLPPQPSEPCQVCGFQPNRHPLGGYPRPGYPVQPSYPPPQALAPPTQIWAHPPNSLTHHPSPYPLIHHTRGSTSHYGNITHFNYMNYGPTLGPIPDHVYYPGIPRGHYPENYYPRPIAHAPYDKFYPQVPYWHGPHWLVPDHSSERKSHDSAHTETDTEEVPPTHEENSDSSPESLPEVKDDSEETSSETSPSPPPESPAPPSEPQPPSSPEGPVLPDSPPLVNDQTVPSSGTTPSGKPPRPEPPKEPQQPSPPKTPVLPPKSPPSMQDKTVPRSSATTPSQKPPSPVLPSKTPQQPSPPKNPVKVPETPPPAKDKPVPKSSGGKPLKPSPSPSPPSKKPQPSSLPPKPATPPVSPDMANDKPAPVPTATTPSKKASSPPHQPSSPNQPLAHADKPATVDESRIGLPAAPPQEEEATKDGYFDDGYGEGYDVQYGTLFDDDDGAVNQDPEDVPKPKRSPIADQDRPTGAPVPTSIDLTPQQASNI